jgi:hypothetical protein
MNRREFVRSVVALGSAAATARSPLLAQQTAPAAAASDAQVKRVLVMFKCHFDAGFIDTQAAVIHRYFTEYFPQAIRVAEQMRASGPCPYVWTTGSWLLYEYLEQAAPAERKTMEDAIARGDIAWHALPFNWQTELMDSSMIAASVGLSQSLDRRFGRTTTGAKMTDVPGHTRGLIAPIAAQGVTFLDIGVNGASRPAEVPLFFVWKDTSGASLTMMYHHEYGAVGRVPGSDLAIAIVVRGDNSGPHTPAEIAKTYDDLKQQYPNATVTPTNLTEIANAVAPLSGSLPVVTQEIGDTWIYGIASDPLKVARYREVSRLRLNWIERGAFQAADATDLALLRHVLLEAEHTWGTDTKTWLDYDHYTPRDLATMLHTKNYEVVQFSWQEKRQDLFDGIATLPAPLRGEAEAAVNALEAKEPDLAGTSILPAGQEIDAEHFVVALDPKTGAIHKLRNKKTGREWASADHPLALFSYQTLSQQDYIRYRADYLISNASWAKKDFGKPNIETFGAESRTWLPTLVTSRIEKNEQGVRILCQLAIDDAPALASGRAAYPQKIYTELFLPKDKPEIQFGISWFQKPATRMPESIWLSFDPIVPNQNGWTMRKVDEQVSPFDVVTSGSRHMHAVSTGFGYRDPETPFWIETIDAPLVAWGGKSPLNFSRSQPELASGVNNAWGTNYIMWFGEDMRFRFVLHA